MLLLPAMPTIPSAHTGSSLPDTFRYVRDYLGSHAVVIQEGLLAWNDLWPEASAPSSVYQRPSYRAVHPVPQRSHLKRADSHGLCPVI